MPHGQDIASRIARVVAERNEGAVVSDVRLGLGYTAVMLADGRLGLAYTFREETQPGCSVFHKLRPLSGRHSSELVALLSSKDPIEAAVGLACANALINVGGPGLQDGDVLGHLELRPDDHVGMVGYFGPIVERLEGSVGALTVFERASERFHHTRPAEEAEGILPGCQIALITATSIINHSMHRLLEAASQCREVVVLGGSTPLLPEVFSPRRVTLLSGLVVTEPRGILRVVSEGGGMRYFGPHVSKVCLRIEE
jgi:uncharacterized protein (DUF4213/DUF364 family)